MDKILSPSLVFCSPPGYDSPILSLNHSLFGVYSLNMKSTSGNPLTHASMKKLLLSNVSLGSLGLYQSSFLSPQLSLVAAQVVSLQKFQHLSDHETVVRWVKERVLPNWRFPSIGFYLSHPAIALSILTIYFSIQYLTRYFSGQHFK